MAGEVPSSSEGTTLIEQELKDSYLNYAMSVIVSRALPDVRDGLKPSQRRILVAMNDLRLGPTAKHRKCAKIAGDTSGNYHPHGEQVVYPTLVRLAQEWVMRYPLADGQGNFGSIDGDPPAAMRYTEARMSSFGVLMLDDIEHETVDFVPNYDETRQEPTVLPGKFPNLLCNGASGIAVGMATSIPPHNLREVAAAIEYLLDHPDATAEDLLALIPGPDFPTGGIICGTAGIREGYTTGRGVIRVRGRASVEESRGRKRIVITEIPYNVSKGALLERIADLVREERITGVTDIRDESDRRGMRVVVELAREQDERVVLNQLYALTPLQETFSIILIALVDRRPRLLTIRDLVAHYIAHRRDVVRRRTRHLLGRAEEEEHVTDGLVRALDVLDGVIATIRSSHTPEIARAALEERFGFSTRQAEAILRMPLQRLTGLEREKLAARLAELRATIADYRDILARDERVTAIIRQEVRELAERHGDPRRTEISPEEIAGFEIEELIPQELMAVVLTHQGYIKRVPLAAYRRQRRGGKGVIGTGTREDDVVAQVMVGRTHDTVLFFTETGRVHSLKVYELPELERASRGKPVGALLDLPQEERVATVLTLSSLEEGFLVMATRQGRVKRTSLSAFANIRRGGIRAIMLAQGDRIVRVVHTGGQAEILLATARGRAIRFSERMLRPMGRAAGGVRGVRLEEGDEVVAVEVLEEDGAVLTVCSRGYGKRSAVSDYRRTARGGKGVLNVRVTERNGPVVAVRTVRDDDEILIMSQSGMAIRTPVKGIPLLGRRTQGVRLARLAEGDCVVSVARVLAEEEEEGQLPQHPPVVGKALVGEEE